MMSTGRLLSTPPSTRRSRPWRTGGKMPGSVMLARTALANMPLSWMTISARVKFAETQKYGTQHSSMRQVAEVLGVLEELPDTCGPS